MPVDAHAPYAKDYGKGGLIRAGWGVSGHFMGTFNGPRRLCWAQNCPLGRGEKPQPGDPAPPTCDMNLCRSTCRVSVFLLSGRGFTASEGGGWLEEAVAGGGVFCRFVFPSQRH